MAAAVDDLRFQIGDRIVAVEWEVLEGGHL